MAYEAGVPPGVFNVVQGDAEIGRALVRTLLDRFLDALVPRVEALPVGHPMDPKTRVGALISAGHRERVLDHIGLGRREGAALLTGGEPGRTPC